jgi:nucleotide-binding universal stress UspA family protein
MHSLLRLRDAVPELLNRTRRREMMAKSPETPKILLPQILCATDFSAHSASVLAHAAAIARRYRAKLYVAHVVPTDVYRSVPSEVMAEAMSQTRGYVRDAMHNQLALEFIQTLPTEAVIREGSVALELLRLIDELKAALLVIGTRAHHGLERMLEGSVAEEVFRQARCPVLVVPPAAGEQSGIPIRTVLFPTSFSQNSLRAAPYAFSLARRHRARLVLLHVSPENVSSSDEDLASLRVAGEERLRALLPAKGGSSVEPWLYVEFGPAAERIVRVAVENHAGLIVLGIATAGVAAAHLAEGDAYKVIGASPCPVLTIRG